ncbi:MAG: TetR/AcrR family transcriptional regulator [Anaerolineales bacterium]|nr:TetR/AcrR family transcriptional regulator [Anaerolineales bacterium]
MNEHKYHHGDLKNALIGAGVDILAEEGLGGLSLRKVAARAGVSHAAPYAHFADKQDLIAAISTEGYHRLYERIEALVQRYQGDPPRQLIEVACAYVEFARKDPAHFRITFSGVIETEKNYPTFVEISQKNLQLVTQVVEACQSAGILKPGPADATAVSIWSSVHGLASLLIEGQISHTLLDRMSRRELTVFLLNQVTLVELRPEMFPAKAI